MTSTWGAATWPFTTELMRFAERAPGPCLRPVVARLHRPVRVVVAGRRGVGRSTVAAALRARGVHVVPAEAEGDVRVVVIAEALKSEDRALLAAAPVPTVLVLTKADVIGSSSRGPVATAERRAADIAAATGVRVVVMIGLLATVTSLDDELAGALRTLVDEPAELSSVDAFVEAPHSIDRDVRARLLDRLDRFGIAHAVLALTDGGDAAAVVERLRGLSNVDGVLAALDAATAPVRYQRMGRAMAELRCLAATPDQSVAEFLAADDTIVAAMAAAVDVIEAAGLDVDRDDEPDAHARRAALWSRYARGPVDALHRACAVDIVRGSLRRLDACGTRR